VLILAGDVPVLDYQILQSFIDEFVQHKDTQYAAGILTTSTPSPAGYGRILRDEKGNFSGTIEQKDIPEDRADLFAIKEISTGTLIFRYSFLDAYIKRIGCDNKQNEYYLPDVVNLLHKDRHSILAYNCDRIPEIHGANDMTQLKQIETWMSQS
jgi:bifunctional UDP-N-acetylglucosamine pyrophosphorylase/glucosamine-1-phosphate N-acetyltransferase